MNLRIGFLSVALFFFSFLINAEELKSSDDLLFKGIIKQSHDNTCGIAALSTLINGIIENSHVTEDDVVNAIKTSSNDVGDEGYSLRDLQQAAEKLGHHAEWRKINRTVLPKIKQPVIVLVGLNANFPHFVVLKGIINNEAFLADPIRGNIRIDYKQLVTESINEKYPSWYVMAINPSKNKPQDSVLYLSAVESERFAQHMTADQSNIITLTTVARYGQIIADYGFNATINNAPTDFNNYENTLYASYGISETSEIGGSISSDLTRQGSGGTGANQAIAESEAQAYSLFFKNRFQLDNANRHGIVAGIRGSLLNNRNEVGNTANNATIYGGGINALYYRYTNFAQLIGGISANKQFSGNQQVDDSLPEYQISGYVSANKPFANRYLASLGFSVNDGSYKSGTSIDYPQTYAISTSVSYVLTKKIQISPSFNYSFGNGDFFTFGLDIAYVGRW
jgi:predicted double-glycine peptidase